MSRDVRQGEILKETIDRSNDGIEMVDKEKKVWLVKHIEYGDDLCIITKQTANDATKMLNNLQNYLENIEMRIA
ncbi:unnamed protein product [Schistosoma haematobium]|nr:unnamed protein product [Schistosoma haematobium]